MNVRNTVHRTAPTYEDIVALWTPHLTMLLALEAFLNPAAHIVLRIDDGDEADRWNAATDAAHRHGATVFTIPANESDLHGALAEQGYRRGGVAWLCAGHACLPPITDPMALVEALANPHPAHAR